MENKNIEINFQYSCSFVGSTYSMCVNGKTYSFGYDNEEKSKIKALKILKDFYCIDKQPNEIEFIQDETL